MGRSFVLHMGRRAIPPIELALGRRRVVAGGWRSHAEKAEKQRVDLEAHAGGVENHSIANWVAEVT
jgi:hypothetical protein